MQNMTHKKICPTSLAEAVEKSWALLSKSEKHDLQHLSLHEAGITMHFTVGGEIRAALDLWGDDTEDLFNDINLKILDHLAIDADSASAALIELLWKKARAAQ